MTKQDILDYFRDINYVYNNCNKHDDLSRMLDELVETQPRWIPCSERLPEEHDYYLVTIKWRGSYSGDVYIETNMATYRERQKEWDCADVIAWMPLPEPYRGIKHTCNECIIKDTDACSRGNTEADEVACEDFVGGERG